MRLTVLISSLLMFNVSVAQYGSNRLGISLNANYTTTAQIFLSPNSSDPHIRNSAFELEKIYSPSIDIRYRISDGIILGFSTEYLKKTAEGRNLTVIAGNTTETIVVSDGFELVPIELSGYYLMPFSTQSFKFLMGGGVGYYFANHIRKFGDSEISNLNRKAAYGVQVSVAAEYLINSLLSVKAEIKFRDPQATVTTRYDKKLVNLNGRTILIAQDSFESKINVDGVTFSFGAVFQL